MTSDALCECHLPPMCSCCQREVERVRGSIWHGTLNLCDECFLQWYDPDNGTIDNTDPMSIGNYVRKKHGLPALPGDIVTY
jgi:hypothetical protein